MVFVSQIRLFYNGQNVSNPADRNLINSIPKKTINVEVCSLRDQPFHMQFTIFDHYYH